MRFKAHLKPLQFTPWVSKSTTQKRSQDLPKSFKFTWKSSEEIVATAFEPVTGLAAAHKTYLEQQAVVHQAFLQQYQALMTHLSDEIYSREQTLPVQVHFSRDDLEQMASGPIAPYFGKWFEPLDQYERLIRMPEPPLLLTDRIIAIDAEPGSMGLGSIWTETDVKPDAWYLHHGRMPAGIMIEAGQADLLLASWLGFDLENKGERVYRLLGCDLSFHGELPKIGETLKFDIHIHGQARQGDIRLFFFHYDCYINGELRIKVRNGQAGFFTREELANANGVLWSAETAKFDASLPFDPPILACEHKQFSHEQLKQFSIGNVYSCFGHGFEITQSHTRSPHISAGNMLLLDEITHFDRLGGPYQRGYMRAIKNIKPDDWYFQGHFKNDPCMPGTLMCEAGLQVIACYMTALGFTLNRDGWRFELVCDLTAVLRCRGQVTPSSSQVIYEIFVFSIKAEPFPEVLVDLLGSSDGLKIFHGRFGLRLIPDWPLSEHDLSQYVDHEPAAVVDGFRYDYKSILACAWGKPSAAFGPRLNNFPAKNVIPRLPAPPYLLMSRVTEINAEFGSFKAGSSIEAEYDIPLDAWYFSNNPALTMPFCVLLETALQPCGWLATYLAAFKIEEKCTFLFRNLNGTGHVLKSVVCKPGKLHTRVFCKFITESAGNIICSFESDIFQDGKLVFHADSAFGFFPFEAFAKQVGLPPTEEDIPKAFQTEAERRRRGVQQSLRLEGDGDSQYYDAPSDFYVDLRQQAIPYFTGKASLPSTPLMMLDAITGYWPTAGNKGLGIIRAEKKVVPSEWFFKAHFFQNPVQPGSLGLESMLQLLQFYMLENGLVKSKQTQGFVLTSTPMTWKYRGQVVPENKLLTTLLEVTGIFEDDTQITVTANASLWVDGKKIYLAQDLSLSIVPQDVK